MQNAAAYIRVSTEDQMEFSPDSQLHKIKEYALSHSLALAGNHIYVDQGLSGRQAHKRPGFMEMIAQAKRKPRPFDTIIVWKFSRFARNRQDSILYKSLLRKECGIQVVSVTEQLSSDPSSMLMEALLEAMDEYYSINLAQEVRRGMQEKFSRGGVVSIPPFGYRMEEKSFAADEQAAPVVVQMFMDFSRGKSCKQIAMDLNEMGIRTARGNLFEARSVKYILSNPVYMGKQRRGIIGREAKDRFYLGQMVEVVAGTHPPLVSEELFNKVQKGFLQHAVKKNEKTN